jgi:hypothetical protein
MIDLFICRLFGFLESGVPGRVVPLKDAKQYAVTLPVLLVIALQLLREPLHLFLLLLKHMDRIYVLSVRKEDHDACNRYSDHQKCND